MDERGGASVVRRNGGMQKLAALSVCLATLVSPLAAQHRDVILATTLLYNVYHVMKTPHAGPGAKALLGSRRDGD